MKPRVTELLRGLRTVTQLLTGVVVLMLVGTVILIYVMTTHSNQDTNSQSRADVQFVDSSETLMTHPNEVSESLPSLLANGPGLQAVEANCLGCHSAKLIVQNRFTREGWAERIVWMQNTQGLWDLGDAEPAILDYLAEHYAPETRAHRRQPLTDVVWYELPE